MAAQITPNQVADAIASAFDGDYHDGMGRYVIVSADGPTLTITLREPDDKDGNEGAETEYTATIALADVDVQNTCRPGDPDPNPPRGGDSSFCGKLDGGYWTCTRDTGHTGQHVAGNGRNVASVWPQD